MIIGKKDFEDLQKFTALSTTSPAEAMTLFQELPDMFKRMKGVQLIRIQAASQLDDDTYLKTLTEYLKMNPGDASGDLLGIDYYILRKEYESAIACVERLEIEVGGDPMLADMIEGIRALKE